MAAVGSGQGEQSRQAAPCRQREDGNPSWMADKDNGSESQTLVPDRSGQSVRGQLGDGAAMEPGGEGGTCLCPGLGAPGMALPHGQQEGAVVAPADTEMVAEPDSHSHSHRLV